MGYTKIEFPCGTTIETTSMWHFFGDSDYRYLHTNGCPVHGHKCINKKSKSLL